MPAIRKSNMITILLAVLFVAVTLYYNLYVIALGESYLQEEVYVKNLVLDMMCDIVESGDDRTALINAVSEIDTLKQRGVYCAVYNSDLKIISQRTPLYDVDFDVLSNNDLKRDVRLQNRGKTTQAIEGNADYKNHTMYIYFRWVYYDSEDPILVILGMSKFAIETEYEGGLTTGAWVIAAAFMGLGGYSISLILKRRKVIKKEGSE